MTHVSLLRLQSADKTRLDLHRRFNRIVRPFPHCPQRYVTISDKIRRFYCPQRRKNKPHKGKINKKTYVNVTKARIRFYFCVPLAKRAEPYSAYVAPSQAPATKLPPVEILRANSPNESSSAPPRQFRLPPSVRDEASCARLTKRNTPQEASKRTAPFSRPRHTIPSQFFSALSSLPLTVNVPPSAGSRKVAVVFAGTVVPNVHVLPFKTDKTSILPCGDS